MLGAVLATFGKPRNRGFARNAGLRLKRDRSFAETAVRFKGHHTARRLRNRTLCRLRKSMLRQKRTRKFDTTYACPKMLHK